MSKKIDAFDAQGHDVRFKIGQAFIRAVPVRLEMYGGDNLAWMISRLSTLLEALCVETAQRRS